MINPSGIDPDRNFGHEETAHGVTEVTQVSDTGNGDGLFIITDTKDGRRNPTIIDVSREQATFVRDALEKILTGDNTPTALGEAELFDSADRETFERAIETWGIDAQVERAEEEAAEFLVASKHYARGKADGDDLIDELADLRIMIEQLSLFVGREATEQRVREKMERLRQQLEAATDG